MKIRILSVLILNLFFFSCSNENVNPNQYELKKVENAEVGSGGGGGGSTTCSPVTSFKVKGDYIVGESGQGGIDVSYAVKPCLKNQNVRVKIDIVNYTTKEVVNSGDNLPLSGKFQYQSSTLRGIFTAVISVYDTSNNQLVGTQSFSVNIKWPGV